MQHVQFKYKSCVLPPGGIFLFLGNTFRKTIQNCSAYSFFLGTLFERLLPYNFV